MDSRRVAAVVFVALCLGLSGLVLSRQIVSHPLPRHEAFHNEPTDLRKTPAPSQPLNPKTWRLASKAAEREARNTIQNQLIALRTGDTNQAVFYQSRGLRRRFRSPQEFVTTIVTQHPEFGHSRSVQFSPVWTDSTSQYADVIVTVRGENGRRARGYYQLVREDGQYKVAGVRSGRVIN